MSDPTAELLAELRSLLDETTILSIAGDYDLTDPTQFAAVRDVLLTIAKDVPLEEASGFNPSGLGPEEEGGLDEFQNRGDDAHGHGGGGGGRAGGAARSGTSESDLKSNDGLTTASTATTTEGMGALSLGSSASSPRTRSSPASRGGDTPGVLYVGGIFDGLTESEKEQQLAEMFTSLKPVDVRLALKKAGGNASAAIDSLLNLQWLEQTGQRVKGVEGFYLSDEDRLGSGTGTAKRKKQGKRKGQKKQLGKGGASRSEPHSPRSPGSPAEEDVMDDEQHDANIAFIAEKLNQPASDVTNIYYRHGNSSGATIVEILDNFLRLGLTSSDQSLLQDVHEQSTKYPWIPREYIGASIEISPSYEFAIAVINVLGGFFEKPAYMKYNVAYSVVASDKDTEFDSVNSKNGSKSGLSQRGKTIDLRPSPLPQTRLPTTLQKATANTSLLAAAKDHSYASASSAFRKGRSDPLFRQAAGYYAERAREQATNHRQAISVETNMLVDQQSTRGMVDLHGATVQDGVEIALDRCWRWWDGLNGEDRARQAKEGFVVVTGLGRHTTDGRSRLRTNVFKALVADGWKAEVLTGAYLVTGRRR
ncbi:uncharacterized protein B0I36DRAFT_311521 [Microdochium trichocladiopsis]|uniref:Smr domain-containing protein n=1 Tax=Microdochium trichocladiopsis TaxID=1682393 RepID=A0A9P8YIB4_9PEZI|nr:uncharacterized protein B0I36DRAFT_311521 [Microdochium trichocladiopsis]KAH7040805.1 hypothetical protein B0I36DRAFT_311521 [Microdochium trichocladiopsis]